MKKIKLISAAFGRNQKELSIVTSLSNENYTCDVVLYNDSNTPSRANSLHPRLKGKIPKMLEWLESPDYDYYIWVDAAFTIYDGFIENIMQFAEEDFDLYLFAHTKRKSIKAEFDHLNNKLEVGNQYLINRYGGERMKDQVETYLADQSFSDNQLFFGGCLMYSNTLVANPDYNLMTDWFLHNVRYSIMDQLSLPYLLHKHQTKYMVYPHVLMRNKFLVHDFSIFY
jgi:hypothetical protein